MILRSFTTPTRSCRRRPKPPSSTLPASPTSFPLDVEPITRRQLAELAGYDGLFIRETTSIDNHTYRFARRAWQEGMPVIDDPISMIRCMNKVFLMELMRSNQVPTPPTVMLADQTDLPRAMDQLGLPLVVKIHRRFVLARRPQGLDGRRVQAHSRRTVRGNRSHSGAAVSADGVRLAGRRVVGPAAVRMPVSHGARTLADSQAPS